MKNENIKKINTLGKIGSVLTSIMIGISILGIIMIAIMSVMCLRIPNNLIEADIQGSGELAFAIDEDGGKPIVRVGSVQLFGIEMWNPNTTEDVLEEVNTEKKIGGMNVNLHLNKDNEKTTADKEVYNADIDINGGSDSSLGMVFFVIFVMVTAMTICFTVAMFFARNLCKALEVCESPFENSVVKRLKSFAVSLIPWGVIGISLGGISAVGIAVIVIIVLLFSAIFNYGAELQRESDETL
ncbi:MAG: hypothetical protein MJ071_03285 [Oscillospiraceae bacterium]|nr:hypothetical protein [Oscillospiraceae bacterium]